MRVKGTRRRGGRNIAAKIRSCHDGAKMIVVTRKAHEAGSTNSGTGRAMPSLMRLLAVIGVIAALGYGAMFALATFVDPKTREMVVTVSPDHFVKPQH
jgi:hypothetical protein